MDVRLHLYVYPHVCVYQGKEEGGSFNTHPVVQVLWRQLQ